MPTMRRCVRRSSSPKADSHRGADRLRADAADRPIVSASAGCRPVPCSKIRLIYDEPSGGPTVSQGRSFAPGSAADLTIDSCTDSGSPGGLTVITEGPGTQNRGSLALKSDARRCWQPLPRAIRREGSDTTRLHRTELVGGTVLRWRDDRAHTPPGVLTEFGPALRSRVAESIGPERNPRPSCTVQRWRGAIG